MIPLDTDPSPAVPWSADKEAAPMPRALTPRETDVMRLLVRGERLADIGLQLGIARSTVETHRRRIYLKADVSTRFTLQRWARRQGLIRERDLL